MNRELIILPYDIKTFSQENAQCKLDGYLSLNIYKYLL